MNTNQNHSIRLDYVDLALAVIALEHFAAHKKSHWHHVDDLIARRAYLTTCDARTLHKFGKLNEAGLLNIYAAIDDELEAYDNAPSVSSRHALIQMFNASIIQFRRAAQEAHQQRKDARHAA